MLGDLSTLLDFLKANNISQDDICLTAGTALAAAGVRTNKDIDITVSSSVLKQLNIANTTKNYTNKPVAKLVDIKLNYCTNFGIADDELVNNSNYYHIHSSGFKYVRPELIFSHKLTTPRKRDREDVKLIGDWCLTATNWEWKYFLESPAITFPTPTKPLYSRLLSLTKRIVKRVLSIRNYAPALKQDIPVIYLVNSRYLNGIIVQDLISKHYTNYEFDRYDTIVRYSAIECINGENDYGLQLYEKMQQTRGTRDNSSAIFSALINKINQDGIDPRSNIEIDIDGKLVDGSHRLACALYYNQDIISTRIRKGKFVCPDYSINWFKNNGFSADELNIIEEKRVAVFRKAGLFFQLILWPPAKSLFDDILTDVRAQQKVISTSNLKFTPDNFDQFVKNIYEMDDIADWKVERKLWRMHQDELNVRVIEIEIPQPKYRIKNANKDAVISATVEGIKKELRNKYKGKVDNYIYDVLLHIGDNNHHNKLINKIIERNNG